MALNGLSFQPTPSLMTNASAGCKSRVRMCARLLCLLSSHNSRLHILCLVSCTRYTQAHTALVPLMQICYECHKTQVDYVAVQFFNSSSLWAMCSESQVSTGTCHYNPGGCAKYDLESWAAAVSQLGEIYLNCLSIHDTSAATVPVTSHCVASMQAKATPTSK